MTFELCRHAYTSDVVQSCVVLEIVMVPTMCFWTTSYSRSEEALCTTGVSKRHQTLTFSPKH